MAITRTVDRVPSNTSRQANERIARQTRANLDYYAEHPGEISQRLSELDQEWDIERVLETGATTITLLSMLLGTTVSRRFFAITVAVQGFFMQHALQGWCPPLPALRGLGVRTADEINAERYALLAMHGEHRGKERSHKTAAK